jgi:IS30 family transposase
MGWGNYIYLEVLIMVLDLRDKIMIEKLYLAGVDAKEISRRIGKSVDAIRKYIQRNLKDLKEKHEAEKERTREVLRKTKWECSQEISNSNFAKFNRSIYKQARNGDLILDRKVAPVVTFDTPTRITK